MKMKSIPQSALLLALTIPLTSALAQFPKPPSTNASPTVRLVSPHEGALLLAGETIHVCAQARYFTDRVAQVEFFSDANSLGTVTNSPNRWGFISDLFCLSWTNAMAGNHILTAVAIDVGGASVASAPVDISVVTNLPPRVHITRPANGASLRGPTNVLVCAAANDPDGRVVSVEFFDGATSFGVVPTPPVVYVTNRDDVFPIREPYCLTLSNASLGTHILTAVATDNEGAATTSEPVTINLVSDLPPRVHIDHPFNGAIFQEPANIGICAVASDPDGTVTNVELFADGNSLGVAATPVWVTNWWEVHALYCLTWSNATAGTHALTARATDDGGLTTTSAPVNIKVLAPPAPIVKITSPPNGATIYHAPVPLISVCAAERYFSHPVMKVEFFSGADSIGMTTNAPFSCIAWKNVPAGAYTLTAVATDSTGATVTSSPVSVTVTTNRPPPFWR